MKGLVHNLDLEAKIEIHNPAKITRDAKRRRVMNRAENKVYRLVYDKRVVKSDLSTLPYEF